MLNEKEYIQQLLDGTYFKKSKNRYKQLYLLAKYYSQQGLDNNEIRKKIFEWANREGFYIEYSLNKIIYHARNDRKKIIENIAIKINKKDIEEINSRFDSRKVKLIALLMLCYAKLNADRKGEFNLSSVDIAAWLEMSDSNIRRLYIKELVDFGYVQKIDRDFIDANGEFSWGYNKATKKNICNRYKMLVGIHNSGEYVLTNNDIKSFFEEIF